MLGPREPPRRALRAVGAVRSGPRTRPDFRRAHASQPGGGATRVRGWIVRPAGRGRPWCLSHKPPHPGAASTGGAALPFRREVPARSVAAAPAAAAPAAASVQHHQGDDEQGGKHCRRDKPWSSVAGREIAHVDHLPWNPCPPRRHPCAAKVATSPTLPWVAVPSILGMAAWRRPAAPAGPG